MKFGEIFGKHKTTTLGVISALTTLALMLGWVTVETKEAIEAGATQAYDGLVISEQSLAAFLSAIVTLIGLLSKDGQVGPKPTEEAEQ